MSNNLFDDFSSVYSKQWKQKIQFDLKGADYNDTLIWKTNEDINVKPFYHAGVYYPYARHARNPKKILLKLFVDDCRVCFVENNY